MDPYEFGPQDVGTDTPTIDHAAHAAAARNAAATENHARAERIAATLARLGHETLLDLLAALIAGEHRTAAQVIVDIVDDIA